MVATNFRLPLACSRDAASWGNILDLTLREIILLSLGNADTEALEQRNPVD